MRGNKFSIKINDRGGIPYRDYTPETLRKLFLESKTGANFELMSLIEGLTYLGYFIYCHLSQQPEKYDKTLKNSREGSFAAVIDHLCKARVITRKLQLQLHKYREERNAVVHNWLNFKKPLSSDFKDYSYDETLGKLFVSGIKTIGMLYSEIVPSRETWVEYVEKFQGKDTKPKQKH